MNEYMGGGSTELRKFWRYGAYSVNNRPLINPLIKTRTSLPSFHFQGRGAGFYFEQVWKSLECLGKIPFEYLVERGAYFQYWKHVNTYRKYVPSPKVAQNITVLGSKCEIHL